MTKFKIYTKNTCPYCVKAKKLIVENGDEYVDTNVDAYSDEQKATLKTFLQTKYNLERVTVPQIFVEPDYDYIGGYDQLVKYYEGKDNE